VAIAATTPVAAIGKFSGSFPARWTAMLEQTVISDAESRVMYEIWRQAAVGEQVTSRQIIRQLQKRTDWSSGTIKTLLHRLVEKDVLEFQRKGNRYLYRARISESVYVEQLSNQLLHTVFDGRPIPMLQYLVQSARLSGDEIESLRQLLLELRQSLPPLAPRDFETARRVA
jgi:BlaI family penicillinase repressor